MKILNLHGLNGSSHNTNYNTLVKYFKDRDDVEIVSPQIDYSCTHPLTVLSHIHMSCRYADLVVGNSFGGFFAYVYGAALGAKTLLVNPCIPPYEYIPELVSDYMFTDDLRSIWTRYSGTNFNYRLLLGDSDEVLDIQKTLNTLNPSHNRITIINGGHSLSGEQYELWFKENLL